MKNDDNHHNTIASKEKAFLHINKDQVYINIYSVDMTRLNTMCTGGSAFNLLSEMSGISRSSHIISDLEIIVMWLCPKCPESP